MKTTTTERVTIELNVYAIGNRVFLERGVEDQRLLCLDHLAKEIGRVDYPTLVLELAIEVSEYAGDQVTPPDYSIERILEDAYVILGNGRERLEVDLECVDRELYELIENWGE